jgi:hypothetical protein
MNLKRICRVVVVAFLDFALCAIPFSNVGAQSRSARSRAESSSFPSKGQVDGSVAGIVVGLVGGTAVVVYLLMRKPTVTGCVAAGDHTLTLTADGGHTYFLTGNTAGVTPGNRVKLQGKKQKSADNTTPFVWETEKISKDYGACRP